MKNRITASVEFFFRGKKISAVVDLDLDRHMQATGKLPSLFPLLASAGEIDVYSYEYEMMQAEIITFSKAEGLAKDFLIEDRFDIQAFEQAWREYAVYEKLQAIAKQHLAIENLQQHPELNNALLQAYRMGEESTCNNEQAINRDI